MSVRRSRTALLIATVALSSALIAAVACAMASVHHGVRQRVESTVGAADVRISRIGKDPLVPEVLAAARAWPETRLAVARLSGPIALKSPRSSEGQDEDQGVKSGAVDGVVPTIGFGLDLPGQWDLYRHPLVVGRHLGTSEEGGDGEIMLDSSAAEALGARLGDRLEVQRFGDPMTLEVVGIVRPPPLGTLSKPESYVTLATMQAINQTPGAVREIDVLLHDPSAAEAVAEKRGEGFEKGIVVRAGSKILSGLNKNLDSSQMGMRIASALSFLAASFIIMTGLTTGVTERQRELAIVRCIGGTRWQMAEGQIATGVIVGGLGALIGLPLGVLGSFVLVSAFPDRLPGGFVLNAPGLMTAAIGSIVAGVLGAAWPAVRAARTSPLEALAVRAHKPRLSRIVLCGVAGFFLAATHVFLLGAASNAGWLTVDRLFWLDIVVGIPALFAGYFLMAVPVTWLIAGAMGPLLSRVLALPRGLLTRTLHATPYRFGFTAAAMMMGLALLVGIWTNGRAIMRDWLGTLEFPDAFVAGLSLSERTRERIEQLPFVTSVAAVSMQSLRTDSFGLKAFDNTNTTFIGFDPEPFFRMTRLTWVQGDERSALEALSAGGAVIVANEFRVARGLGVGDTLTLTHNDTPFDFRIVGVVNSPGLDIASKFFSIGDDYLDNAVNGVFGTRSDLKRLFGNTGIQLIQIGIDPAVDDKEAMKQIRRLAGFEIISAGSGREIKAEITKFLTGTLFIFSLVAVGAMLVACFGVANLIVAGVQARTFEFGVIRAVGGSPGVLVRLVLAEALIVALAACVMGTLMGAQVSWGGQRMYELMLGLMLTLRLPVLPTAAGWLTVIAITLGAAAPTVLALARRRPRELLGAVRG
ncbi:MAG: hypothetical protein KF768_13665 [Phycisphaeraceae bacterium]|nr:hypothetical protein [Phycisphaeraceae bacterium]